MHYASVCALNLKPCVQYRNPSEISDRERIDQSHWSYDQIY